MPMKERHIFLKIFFIVVLTCACFYAIYLAVQESGIVIPSLLRSSSKKHLLMSMEGFRFIQSDNGRVSWQMNAQNADLYENNEARLKDVVISYSGVNHSQTSLLSDVGVMDTISGDATFLKDIREVRIVSKDGYLLTTNSLKWHADDRQVETEAPFKLVGNEIYLEGTGLSADVDIRALTVRKHVKAVLQE